MSNDKLSPRSPDTIIAHAAVIVPDGKLVRVPVEDADPERPWFGPRSVPMVWIKGAGLLALMPSPTNRRIGVVLFDTSSSPAIRRRLAYTKNTMTSVWFRDEHNAANQVADVVESGGALPPEWSWDPHAKFGDDSWLPKRLKPAEAGYGYSELQWEGTTARWEIESLGGKSIVRRNGRTVLVNRRWRMFPTLEEAKEYCEEQDRLGRGR